MAIQTAPTNSFSPNTRAESAKVNTNFTEIWSAFNSWDDWTPSITADSGATYTAAPGTNTQSRWRYAIVGAILIINFFERFTITSGPCDAIDVPLPSGVAIYNPTGASDITLFQATGIYYDGGSRNGSMRILPGTKSGTTFTSLQFRRLGDASANPTWSTNSGSTFGGSIIAEIV